ncbi:MAG: hypothetical protein ACXVMI_10200 [Flavisolibacter sp.]
MSEQSKAVEKDKNDEKLLFASTVDFKNAFNEFSSSNKLDFQIEDIEVQEGQVQNTFQYMFTKNLGILGAVNKSDGGIKELTMLGSGDGTFKSGSNIFLCMAAIIATVDPTLQPEKRGDILRDLGITDKNDSDITNMEGKTERNGIKYYVSSSPSIGFMFGASRK